MENLKVMQRKLQRDKYSQRAEKVERQAARAVLTEDKELTGSKQGFLKYGGRIKLKTHSRYDTVCIASEYTTCDTQWHLFTRRDPHTKMQNGNYMKK